LGNFGHEKKNSFVKQPQKRDSVKKMRRERSDGINVKREKNFC